MMPLLYWCSWWKKCMGWQFFLFIEACPARPWTFSVLAISSPAGARKDGCGLGVVYIKGHTLQCFLFCALLGKVGIGALLWRAMKQVTRLLGFLLFQPELSKEWLVTSERALNSSKWLLSKSATKQYFHNPGQDYLWFDLWLWPNSTAVWSRIMAIGVLWFGMTTVVRRASGGTGEP